MAFSTYAELQAEVTRWAMRVGDTQFASALPGFIALAEAMVENGTDGHPKLRTREMEAQASIVLTGGVGPLPPDYLQFRGVRNPQGDDLTSVAPGWANDAYQFSTGGRSREFAIVGNTIQVWPAGDGPLTMDYYARIPSLSDTNPSNWLLAKYPNVYLFGALIFASSFMTEDQRAPMFAQMYQAAIGGLIQSDTLSKFARASIRTRGATP